MIDIQDAKDAALLKEVKEYLTRTNRYYLTIEIINDILIQLHNKYASRVKENPNSTGNSQSKNSGGNIQT